MAMTMKDLGLKARRIYLVAGLGFVSLMVGAVFSVGLLMRLGPRLHGAPVLLVVPLERVLQNLWCLALLPLLAYAVARVVAIQPWSTAIGALAIGELFVRALRYIQGGADAVFGTWFDFVAWAVIMGASVFLTRMAILKGRAASVGTQVKAQQAAQAKAAEYAEFAAAAAQQAERNAQAESARAGQASSASEEASAMGHADAGALADGVTEPGVTDDAAAAGGIFAKAAAAAGSGAPAPSAPDVPVEVGSHADTPVVVGVAAVGATDVSPQVDAQGASPSSTGDGQHVDALGPAAGEGDGSSERPGG